MASSLQPLHRLRATWSTNFERSSDDDYRLLEHIGAAYAARTRADLPAIVIPLPELEHAVGRRAAGCELLPLVDATFRFRGHEWQGVGAALICHDADVLDAFMVLAADVIERIGDEPTWAIVLQVVHEWQSLLASKGRANPEGELGLWGELWFIANAARASLLLAGWRGPERDSTDFFLDGISVEVKTTRQPRQHHISLTQVPAPVGTFPAWLLSVWVKEDPARGLTVGDLVARIEAITDDPADLLRRLLRAGYSHQLKSSYTTKYVVLDEPGWYAAATVPTVRAADPGVTGVRYRVSLDESTAASAETADGLWKHFHGHGYARSAT